MAGETGWAEQAGSMCPSGAAMTQKGSLTGISMAFMQNNGDYMIQDALHSWHITSLHIKRLSLGTAATTMENSLVIQLPPSATACLF